MIISSCSRPVLKSLSHLFILVDSDAVIVLSKESKRRLMRLMRSAILDVIYSIGLEVWSSVFLDVEMFVSMFVKMFASECLGCVLFFLGRGLNFNSYQHYSRALRLFCFFERSFRSFSVILMLLENFLAPILPVGFIFFQGKGRLSNILFTFSSNSILAFGCSTTVIDWCMF